MCEFYAPYDNAARTTLKRASIKRCDSSTCPIAISRVIKPDYDIFKELENLNWDNCGYQKDKS